MIIDQHILNQAQIIWDYHKLNHSLKKSDCIFTLCSHDTRVAEHAAKLFLEGWAPLMIFSGNIGKLTESLYDKPEAEYFAEIAIRAGVPGNKILIENKATNSGENVSFTRELLHSAKIDPLSFILVQKPFMERRAYATFEKVWPGKDQVVSSPEISFTDYPTKDFPQERIIEIIVGDLQRIKEYPDLGFQIYQEIPPEVWRAYQELVESGFTGHLIRN